MQNKKYNIPLVIGILLIITGRLFKIQHWPFGLELSLFGTTIILLFYSLRFLSKKGKQTIDITAYVFVISYCIHIILRLFKMPFARESAFILFTIGVVYLVQYVIKSLRKGGQNKTTEPILNKTIFVLAAVCIALGLFMKLQHLPGSTVFNIVGFTLAGLWFVSQIRFGRKK